MEECDGKVQNVQKQSEICHICLVLTQSLIRIALRKCIRCVHNHDSIVIAQKSFS